MALIYKRFHTKQYNYYILKVTKRIKMATFV